MENRISDLLDCLEDAGQDLEPRGGNAERVQKRTLEKLNGRQAQRSEQTLYIPPRRRRPLAVLIAAALAVMLLCGSAFAAWKLGAFRFAEKYGAVGEVLDSHAQSYETENEAIPVDFGSARWITAEAGDYHLRLVSLTAEDGMLLAALDVSPKREGVPAFRDSKLSLSFTDYETVACTTRESSDRVDRVELSAVLSEPLADGAEIGFSLSGPDAEPACATFHLGELEKTRQEMAASDRHHYATSARTKDYRFSLCTMTASASSVYAVMDVEALTDYGREHLDTAPVFAVYNFTHQSGGSELDARLLEEGEGVRRYLVGFLGEEAVNEPGDSIGFEILQIYEDGDTAEHHYYLFDVKLEDLIPDAITCGDPQGAPNGTITWRTLSTDALGLSVKGRGALSDDGHPTVELVFRDGRRETVMDVSWHVGSARSEHDALICHYGGSGEMYDCEAYLSLFFGTPLDVSELSAVVVDGQSFTLRP